VFVYVCARERTKEREKTTVSRSLSRSNLERVGGSVDVVMGVGVDMGVFELVCSCVSVGVCVCERGSVYASAEESLVSVRVSRSLSKFVCKCLCKGSRCYNCVYV